MKANCRLNKTTLHQAHGKEMDTWVNTPQLLQQCNIHRTHELALTDMILTGLTPKFPILILYMLILYHETLYGEKK